MDPSWTQLEAPPEPTPAVIPLPSRRGHSAPEHERTWPDYGRCVAGAPPNMEGNGRDRSMADFFWCTMAAQREWSIEETASRLLEVSGKAHERATQGRRLCAHHRAERRRGARKAAGSGMRPFLLNLHGVF